MRTTFLCGRFSRTVAGLVLIGSLLEAGSVAQQARALLREAHFAGGLIVHVGFRDIRLSAAFARVGAPAFVHVLSTDPAKVAQARQYLFSEGLTGSVSVDRFDGRTLPHVPELANLVLVEDAQDLSESEITRVLAPGGVAVVLKEGNAEVSEKAWPAEIDHWPQYLHDPEGTMVSKDRRVGPPMRARWIAPPKWLRNHDFMSSLTGLVCVGGRLFSIIDEGPRRHIYLPSRWYVTARDAFNGMLLWKRRIENWWPQIWPFKSGPGFLPRRIAATAERVYVTLGLKAPLSVLDARSGQTLATFKATAPTHEIVLREGTLYLVVGGRKVPVPYKHASASRGKERDRANREFGWSKDSPPGVVMAVDAASGRVLWKQSYRVAPLTLCVGEKRVFFFDGEHVVALDRASGHQVWVSEKAGEWATPATGYAPRLIVSQEVVALSTRRSRKGRLVGISVRDGSILWHAEQPRSGHFSPEDLFLIGDTLWTAQTGSVQSKGTHYVGVDIRTGQTRYDFVAKQIPAFFMHQRCYPGRATVRYIMTSGTGTEFLRIGTERCELHHWVRGSCIYGIMPACGLLYKPPDTCACYYQSKLAHFCALAPASEKRRIQSSLPVFEKGPAYGTVTGGEGTRRWEWPTYRCDCARSGYTPQTVPSTLKVLWRAEVGGRLSTLTASQGRVYVSSIDRQTLHALDAHRGTVVWKRVVGGRIDSPPTVWHGLVLFGCTDGWVYCLRASDGELVWRYRAAPADDRLFDYGHVASVWPLHGSVLVRNGIAYCLAGRNRFLDGGLRLLLLEAHTGRVLSERRLGDTDPQTGKHLHELMVRKNLPVANADILSCDGTYLYMAAQRFSLEGKPLGFQLAAGKERDQAGEGRHLFCPTGFLDDMWFHRSYWIYGKNAGEGHGEYPIPRNLTPTGRIMVFDEHSVYGFFAHNVGNNINPRTYWSIYAARKDEVATGLRRARRAKKSRSRPKKGRSRISWLWEIDRPPLLANAMVLAGKNLFLGGPPDVADEEKTYGYVFGVESELARQLTRQAEAWEGKEGGVLLVVSAEKGEVVGRYRLPHVPVWDGMVAAFGRLYLSLSDGTVLCMGSR